MVHDDPYLCGIMVKQNGVNNPWYVLRIYFLVSPQYACSSPPKCTPTSQTHTDNPFLLPEVTRVNYSCCLPARTYCVLCSPAASGNTLGSVSPHVINNRLLLRIKQNPDLFLGPLVSVSHSPAPKSFPTTGRPLKQAAPASGSLEKALKNLPVSLCKGLF